MTRQSDQHPTQANCCYRWSPLSLSCALLRALLLLLCFFSTAASNSPTSHHQPPACSHRSTIPSRRQRSHLSKVCRFAFNGLHPRPFTLFRPSTRANPSAAACVELCPTQIRHAIAALYRLFGDQNCKSKDPRLYCYVDWHFSCLYCCRGGGAGCSLFTSEIA